MKKIQKNAPNSREVGVKEDKNYLSLISALKTKIRSARVRAALSVNKQLIELYWHIGTQIVIEQKQRGWGQGVIDQLSFDLSKEFCDMKGFSVRNLRYMRGFALIFSDNPILQQVVAEIPWGHNLTLMTKTSDKGGRVRGEYALKGINKPIGLAEYRIVESLPKKLKTSLPTIEELEKGLSKDKEAQ